MNGEEDMKIACKYWKDCGIKNGGCCEKGLYGGKPSIGICLHECKEYDGPPRESQNISNANLKDRVKYILRSNKKKGGCNCDKDKKNSLQSNRGPVAIYGPSGKNHGEIKNYKSLSP